ncbi:phosphoglycerate mutase [Marinomonas piezotolerans]|uniref:Phosphoglycerate mutase n=1 Tax=Marinomonas piezotolerans TaxID=2213058 RepID=A0A370U891_9GAMM|nr:histidine phosphatase family protein [Marinomonas piezotolerans]RDL43985.1 phosphoglycerate mutase [Marinomonas piezotolerans]
MKLLLIRHPKPDVPLGLCYGQTDVPLVEDWFADAKAISSCLATQYADVQWQFFHSPLSRTALLAKAIAPHSDAVDAIKEIDFGEWESRLWQDIPKAEIDQWGADLAHAAPYDGESLTALTKRVMGWLEGVIATDQDTVLVTHSGVIKVLVAELCGIPLTHCHCFNPSYSTITELELGPGYAVLQRLGAGDWAK